MKTNKYKFKYFNFLVAAAFLLLTSIIVAEKIQKTIQARIYSDIYNKLPCYVYSIKVYPDFGSMIDIKKGPCNNCAGISKKGYLFLPAHCLEVPENFKCLNLEMKLFVDGIYVPLNRQVHIDSGIDVAIYKLPDDMKNKRDFPCPIGKKIHLGDELFIVSTLLNSGIVVRRSFVASTSLSTITSNVNNSRCTEQTFWVDSGGFPGESGTPVVSSDYELVGLVACSLNPVFMGVKYISEYARHIE